MLTYKAKELTWFKAADQDDLPAHVARCVKAEAYTMINPTRNDALFSMFVQPCVDIRGGEAWDWGEATATMDAVHVTFGATSPEILDNPANSVGEFTYKKQSELTLGWDKIDLVTSVTSSSHVATVPEDEAVSEDAAPDKEEDTATDATPTTAPVCGEKRAERPPTVASDEPEHQGAKKAAKPTAAYRTDHIPQPNPLTTPRCVSWSDVRSVAYMAVKDANILRAIVTSKANSFCRVAKTDFDSEVFFFKPCVTPGGELYPAGYIVVEAQDRTCQVRVDYVKTLYTGACRCQGCIGRPIEAKWGGCFYVPNMAEAKA